MYFDFYQLNRKPFGLTPGPDFFWLSEKHKEALATLRYGVMGDLGFLLLTGEVGVGKTALIHRLLASLDESTLVAHITDPGLGINDFFRLLAVEFGIDTPFNSKGEFLIIFERYLRQADKDGKKVLLIVDEAQRINNVLLDQIRVLSNIELSDRKLINIFFIGQPEFKNTLLTSANRPIRQRIAIYYHVKPLTETETGQYIEHRLKIAGSETEIFKPDAVREIFRVSQGFPRGINILCDYALLTGYAAGVKTIDSKIIKECGNELNIETETDGPPPSSQPAPAPEIKRPKPETASVAAPTPPPSQRSKAWAYPVVITTGVAVVIMAGYYFLSAGPERTPPIQEAAAPRAYPLPDAPSPQSAPQPAPPAAENEVASNAPAVTSSARPPEQAATEPPPEANESPGMTPELATPSAPPEMEIGVAPVETTPAQAAPSADDAPPSPAPAEDTDAEPLIAATDVPAETNTPQPRETAPTVSRVETGEPPPTVNSTTTENSQAMPTEQPPAPATGQPALAPLDQSVSAAQGTPGDQPTAVPAAPETDSAISSQPDRAQANADSVADIPADTPHSPPAPPAPAPAPNPAPDAKPMMDGPTSAAGTTTPTGLPATPASPVLPATAAPQPQAAAGGQESTEKPAIDETRPVEDRLRTFLQDYCNAYASKDLDSFKRFFASDALENGKSFESRLPKYQKNFTFIDTIYYRIELQQVTQGADGKMLSIDGDFFLRWLPPDKKWRENAGKITMTLEENGSSFLVHRLDYHSNQPRTN